MNWTKLIVTGLIGCLAACAGHAQPAATPPAAPASQPAAQTQPAPATPPAAPAEEASCQGPDGKMHKFPLDVYDETADGFKTIQDAIAKAKAENKRVLVMWGENWCQFCLYLVDVLQNDPGVSPIVKSDYVWVRVDFGKGFSKGIIKHQALADGYGVEQLKYRKNGKTMGAPALCIIDPTTGQTVGKIDAERECPEGVMGGNDMVAKPLTLQRMFDEKLIQTWLMTWRPPAKPAVGAMNDARVVAKRDSKKMLALFTMPNDESCDAMVSWIGKPEVSAALANTFAVARIDIERMIGGREMLQQAAGKSVLPPYLCMVDETGKMVEGTKPVTAAPTTEAEIETMVKGFAPAAKIGDADKAVLAKSVKGVATDPKK